MTTTPDPGVDYLCEVQLSTPVYRATQEGLEDEAGHVYLGGLLWPTLRRALSHEFYGVVGAGAVTVELAAQAAGAEPDRMDAAAPPNPDAARFRAGEARGTTVILRRRNRATGVLATRFVGKIQRVDHTPAGTIRLECADTLPEVFATLYPRVRITEAQWPTATSEAMAHEAPVPLHLGRHREHTPCRYVEATDRTYTHGTLLPRLMTQHRYVIGGCLARAADGYANVAPVAWSLYRGMPIGAALIPPGEYATYTNRKLGPLLAAIGLIPGGTLPQGTGPTPILAYRVTPLNGAAEGLPSAQVFVQITAADVAAGRRQVFLSWGADPAALGYAIYKTEHAFETLLTIVAGGDAFSFADDGTYQGLGPVTPPTIDVTGTNTLDAVFRQPQLGVEGALAPILADVDATRMAWDGATCRGVWHFDGDGRDATPWPQNPLVEASTVAFWCFERNGQDRIGSNHLTAGGGLRPDDYVIGPHGHPVWLANGTAYFSRPGASLVGMAPGLVSFQVECEVRTDPDTLERTMVLAEHVGTAPIEGIPGATVAVGYTLRVVQGCAYAAVRSSTSTVVEVRGSTRLDGARHRLRLVVNRTTQRLDVYVDDTLEDSASIAGVGSLTPTGGAFTIGTSAVTPGGGGTTSTTGGLEGGGPFLGDVGWVRWTYETAALLPAGDRFDGTEPTQRPLTLPGAAWRGLDLASATGWTVEARVVLPALPTTPDLYGLAGTLDLINFGTTEGYGLYLTASAGFGSPWQAVSVVAYDRAGGGIDTVFAAGGELLAAQEHTVALVYQAPTPTTAGALSTVVDGVVVASTVLPAGPVPTVTASAPFRVGASDSNPNVAAPFQILQVRVTGRARTLAELQEAHYLASRNLVRQVRSVLVSAAHGPGLALDTESWDRAERDLGDIESGKLVTDYALVEPAPLGAHLAELLRLRSVRMPLMANGLLGCLVDLLREPVASFGRRDGYWENLGARPGWTQQPLAQTFQQCRVRFRRRRTATGELDRYVLRTALRDVASVGKDEPELLDCAALRDLVAADLTADYLAKRLALRMQDVTFPTRDDEALDVVPGDRVTLYDPLSGAAATEIELKDVDESGTFERGPLYQCRAAPWSADIYTYTARDLPREPAPDTRPDYSATYPPRVADFDVVFAARIDNEGHRVWSATATWARVTHENIQSLRLEWRPQGTTAWEMMDGVARGQQTAVVTDLFDDGTVYDFRLSGVNRFRLVGTPSVLTRATTLPGAPAMPTTLVALAAGGHGQRRWKWAKNAEKNVRDYHVEVYDSAATGASGPTGTRKDAAAGDVTTVAHPRYAHSETGLAAATARYLRVQAVNRSGQTSLWTALVGATGQTVGTDDLADGAASESYSTPESDLVTEAQLTHNGGFQAVGNLGGVVVPASTKAVHISVDVGIRQQDWGEGGDVTGTVTARLLRAGTNLGDRQLLREIVPSVAGSAPDVSRSFHVTWTDPAPSAGTYTYALQVEYARSGGTASMHVYVRKPKFQITVHKR